MSGGAIDFHAERARHEGMLGREDVMVELDALLLQGEPVGGWVLVKGGPGLGKSALLAHWVARQEEAGRSVPHHFLRHGVEDWDRPEVVSSNLAVQVEALYPALAEVEARPEARLRELLQRVSKDVLLPRRERLVLVVDGLDEAEPDASRGNPLPRMLPAVLPPGVRVLCSSRSGSPHLGWLEARERVRCIDLDSPRWAASNEEAVRRYWEQVAPGFHPPLGAALINEAVRRAGGNMLHAVRLAQWLLEQPPEHRRAELLPEGLEAFLRGMWQRIQQLPAGVRAGVLEGLGLVAVAREALPASCLAALAGWQGAQPLEQFLRAARSFLLEQSPEGAWEESREEPPAERAWRPFHESFRAFIRLQLGEAEVRRWHGRLAEQLGSWPLEAGASAWQRRYGLRHAVVHALEAGRWEQARSLCMDMGYLEARCREGEVAVVEEELRRVAEAARGSERALLQALQHAVQSESHWLRRAPGALAQLVYNQLRSRGWSEAQLVQALRLPAGPPALRLRHPVRMGGGEVRTLVGHRDMVNGCAVAESGRRALSASTDGTLRLWDLETGRELAVLEGHHGGVNGCAITDDGMRALSASEDGTLRLWDLAAGRELAVLEGHRGGVNACVLTADGRRALSASEDGTLKVWDLERRCWLAVLEGHRSGVSACAMTADGRRALSASEDWTLKVWDLQAGRELATLHGHGGAVKACALLADGRHALSAAQDGTLKLWDMETGHELATLEGHQGGVGGCAVLAGGRRVLSASYDGTLKVWDLAAGRVVTTLEGHRGGVMGCAVSSDGRWVVSASGDRTLKVWDLEDPHGPAVRLGHRSIVAGCVLMADGGRALSASRDGTLKVWNLQRGGEEATLSGHGGWVNGCAVTADGQRAVSASEDGTLRVWDLKAGEALATLKGHDGGVVGCAVAPEGRWAVSASRDRTLTVWSLARYGQKLATLVGHRGGVVGCAITPDRQVLSASEDGTLKLWDVVSGQELATLAGHRGGVTGCGVTPDGRAVSASEDGTLKVWDLKEHRELATLVGHTGSVVSCAVTPDGQWAVSASVDRTLRVWDLSSYECLQILYGSGSFTSVAAAHGALCAGDDLGNMWMLELGLGTGC